MCTNKGVVLGSDGVDLSHNNGGMANTPLQFLRVPSMFWYYSNETRTVAASVEVKAEKNLFLAAALTTIEDYNVLEILIPNLKILVNYLLCELCIIRKYKNQKSCLSDMAPNIQYYLGS